MIVELFTRRRFLHRFLAWTSVFLVSLRRGKANTSVAISGNDSNIRFTADAFGQYSITSIPQGWSFPVDIGAPDSTTIEARADRLGDYVEAVFDYTSETPRHIMRVRLYKNRPAGRILVEYPNGVTNTASLGLIRFGFPAGLTSFSYNTGWSWAFNFIHHTGPFMLFDSKKQTAIPTTIWSADSNVMKAKWIRTGDETIESHIDPQVIDLPKGFSHSVLFVVGQGINTTWDIWGEAIRGLHNRSVCDGTDTFNSKLSYWMDAMTKYYYFSNDPTKYWNMILDIVVYFKDTLGVLLGLFQFDSWSYNKGLPPDFYKSDDGQYAMVPSPEIFPDSQGGLAGLQKILNIPFIQHTRWMHTINAYSKIAGAISENVIISQQIWQQIAQSWHDMGIDIYEPDWLADKAQADPTSLTANDQFIDTSITEMDKVGIKTVLCTLGPMHIMKAAEHSAVVGIRASSDGFGRDVDEHFGQPNGNDRLEQVAWNSRFIWSVGARPFTDNVLTWNKHDPGYVVDTSGGIGLGDGIGEVDRTILLQAVLPDGTIVGPDVPAVPIDEMYLTDAAGLDRPMTQYTYTVNYETP